MNWTIFLIFHSSTGLLCYYVLRWINLNVFVKSNPDCKKQIFKTFSDREKYLSNTEMVETAYVSLVPFFPPIIILMASVAIYVQRRFLCVRRTNFTKHLFREKL